jgi:hypothetical protein
MALNGSGPISLAGATAGQSIAVELGLSATGTISLNTASVRTLAGVPSGAIIMPTNFYGKSNAFTYTMTSNTLNGNLRTLVVAAGWNQSTNVSATINSGVYAYSNSTGTSGLVINGSWPGGVTLNNAGLIIGMGGAGGGGGASNQYTACGCIGYVNPGCPGSAGGLALLVQSPVSVNNTGTIGGGGGGGGGSGAIFCSNTNSGGGGGGGGRTGLTNSAAGGGGGGGTCSCTLSNPGSPGGAGTVSGAGGGGSGFGSSGGSGGGWGANGGGGGRPLPFGQPGGPGGAGGAATSGSASFITWIATGTRNGTIG